MPFSFVPARRRAVLALALLTLFVLPAIFLYPFHADIDIQQVMAWTFYRFHGLPYLGSWDSNFPGTVFIHASAMALFGNSEFSLRLMDVLFQIASLVLLYKIGRFWLDRGAALFGIALYALFYINGPGQYMSQRDAFAILPILSSIWCTVSAYRSQSRPWIFFAGTGIFIGIAFWIRPTYGLLLLPPLALFQIRSIKDLKPLLSIAFGFGSIVAIGLLPYVLIPHGIEQFYLATIRYNIEVYSHLFAFRDYSRRAWVAVALLAVWLVAVIVHARRRERSIYRPASNREIFYIVFVFFSLIAGIAVMRRLASYHFAPFFACIMPVVAAVLWEACGKRPRATGFRTATVALAIVILYPWSLVASSFSLGAFSIFTHDLDRFSGQDGSIANYVEEHSKPFEAVEVASFTSPGPRWRIDRPFATRFTTIQGLFANPNGNFTDYQNAWRSEYVRSLEEARTRFIVVDNALDASTNRTTLDLLLTLPGFQPLLDRYHLDTAIGTYYLYRRAE